MNEDLRERIKLLEERCHVLAAGRDQEKARRLEAERTTHAVRACSEAEIERLRLWEKVAIESRDRYIKELEECVHQLRKELNECKEERRRGGIMR